MAHILTHKKWQTNETRYDGDISLLILQQKVQFNEFIRPICLAVPEQFLPPFDDALFVGYEKAISGKNLFPKVLRLPVHENVDCLLAYPDLARKASLWTLCAGVKDTTPACLGTKGDGLYYEQNGRYFLIGIASAWLNEDIFSCENESYMIYTNTSFYVEWIDEIDPEDYPVLATAVVGR